jgi:hypothetical protein
MRKVHWNCPRLPIDRIRLATLIERAARSRPDDDPRKASSLNHAADSWRHAHFLMMRVSGHYDYRDPPLGLKRIEARIAALNEAIKAIS